MKKKICMLGYYGVGKTSLVSQFVNHVFAESYQTTIGVKVDKKTVSVYGREIILNLWDVAGEEDDAPLKLSYVREAMGYLLVADGCRSKTLDAAIGIQEKVQAEFGPLPFILLANKADQRAQWEIQDSALADLRARGWTVLESSAKTGENVERAFLELAQAMLKAQTEAEED